MAALIERDFAAVPDNCELVALGRLTTGGGNIGRALRRGLGFTKAARFG